MYKAALGLQELGRFANHAGFDGVMLGVPGAACHFEFTSCPSHPVRPAPTAEDLWVYYLPGVVAWQAACALMLQAGFTRVGSFNPYWDQAGRSFQDHDGYRIVMQREAWATSPPT